MLTAAALLVLQVAVADTTKPKPFPVKFQGDLGYVSTAGNTSVETLNFGNRITGTFGSVVLTQTFNGVSGKSKGAVVTSLWRGSFRADVKLENTFTAYSLTTYERNRFAGLASRVGNIIGLSAQVMRGPRNRLSIEGGVSLTAQPQPAGRSCGQIPFTGAAAAQAPPSCRSDPSTAQYTPSRARPEVLARTTAVWPARTANSSGVKPDCNGVRKSAPAAMSASTTAA